MTENQAIGLNGDMVSTWTVLQELEDKVCVIQEQAFTVDSKLDAVDTTFDLSAVYTVLDALTEKACTIFDGVQTIEVQGSTCITDFGPTFTAIETTFEVLCSLESKVEVLTSNIENIIDLRGNIITISRTASDFSDTFSITEPGRYALVDDVDFDPGSNSVIYIDSDDVHIDLCDRTIRQVNANSGVDGIVIASGHCNISIANGKIRDFTGSGIEFLGESSFVRISNFLLIENGSDQLLINSSRVDEGANNIIFRKVMITGDAEDCIHFNNGSGIFCLDCSVTEATGEGIQVNACDYVCFERCVANSSANGFVCAAVAANSDQQFGATNFVLNACKAMHNTTDGIRIIGFNKNGVIVNSWTELNGDGIRFAMQTNQAMDSKNICFVYNISASNTGNGIQIDGDASNNYFAFNQMWDNGSTSVLEDSGEGPNSFLRNIAFRTAGTNYSAGNSVINSVALQEDASFPTPEPTYWINVNMTQT